MCLLFLLKFVNKIHQIFQTTEVLLQMLFIKLKEIEHTITVVKV
jgi:hypothetical protein